MKPLLRWTLGPTSECGFDILKKSVSSLKQKYDFDFVICYNNLNKRRVEALEKLNVELVNQEDYLDSINAVFPKDKKCAGWKFCPPRLREDAHEIFMDNDMIILERIEEIDLFLKSDCLLLYEGLHFSYGNEYRNRVPKGFQINSGIFGFPPKFQFGKYLNNLVDKWHHWNDDQAVLASICLTSGKYFIIIPQSVIPIIEPSFQIEIHLYNLKCKGFHFVKSNQGGNEQFYKYASSLKKIYK